jgi:hypothetical protein
MKKMSMLLVIAMVLQSAPMVFAGGTPINSQTGIGGQNNQGLGGQNNQNAGSELDVYANQNQTVVYGIGGQNNQGLGGQNNQNGNNQQYINKDQNVQYGKGGGPNLLGVNSVKAETVVDLRPYQEVKKETPGKGGKGNQQGNQQQNQQGNQQQNQQGLQMIPLQVVSPSGGMYSGNAYVLNGIGDLQQYIQQCQQNGVAVKPGKGSNQQQYVQNGCNTRPMSEQELRILEMQMKYQHQKDMYLLQQKQIDDQRLHEEAIRRQQAREQKTMMMFQMFGMMVPMALMTYQQHKDARDTRKAYEQYRRDQSQYYQNRRSYRYNFPQQQYQGQQYQYGQFMAK